MSTATQNSITFNHYVGDKYTNNNYSFLHIPTVEILHMLMVAIELYEPGLAKYIQEQCGIYKNKLIHNSARILRHIKRINTGDCTQEGILIRKIDANVITRWTLVKSLKDNSTLEIVYVDKPFRKKKRTKNGKRKMPNTKTYNVGLQARRRGVSYDFVFPPDARHNWFPLFRPMPYPQPYIKYGTNVNTTKLNLEKLYQKKNTKRLITHRIPSTKNNTKRERRVRNTSKY